MKMKGKLEAYRAKIIHGIVPFDISFSGTASARLRFGTGPEAMENIDDEAYAYSDQQPDTIIIRDRGWYDLRYTINFEQTSSRRDNVYSYLEVDYNDDGIFTGLPETFSIEYVRNRNQRFGTLITTRPFRVPVDNAKFRFVIRAVESGGSINLFVPANQASFYIRKLRPLQPNEEGNV